MTIRKTFTVEGMECPSCAMRLEGLEDSLPGVRQVEASYRQGQMVVEFDPAQVDEAKIIAAATKLGYPAKAA